MSVQVEAALCTEVRMSPSGRVWVCVLEEAHETGKHYMICTD